MSEQQEHTATVRDLAIYPVKDEPGQRLTVARIEAEGLAGDRRKKRPVHLVGAKETPETTRANVFLDIDDDAVGALLDHTVRLGGADLLITERPTGCPGVYAVVAAPGPIAVGDRLTITHGSASEGGPTGG